MAGKLRECAQCKQVHARESMQVVPAGWGRSYVAGPAGPAGWRGVDSGRWVRHPRTAIVCGRCAGERPAALPQPAPAGYAAASGFTRRYQPAAR